MKSPLPLIDGFKQALADFKFDTSLKVSPMPTPAEILAASLAYDVTSRAIYRWLKNGLQSLRPEDVALHLAAQHSPAPQALAAVIQTLETNLSHE